MRKFFWAFAVVALFCACSGKNTKKQGADAASDEAFVEVTVKYATGFSVRDSADIRLALPISVWWMRASMTNSPS